MIPASKRTNSGRVREATGCCQDVSGKKQRTPPGRRLRANEDALVGQEDRRILHQDDVRTNCQDESRTLQGMAGIGCLKEKFSGIEQGALN
jgi:hypothetical protein